MHKIGRVFGPACENIFIEPATCHLLGVSAVAPPFVRLSPFFASAADGRTDGRRRQICDLLAGAAAAAIAIVSRTCEQKREGL